MSLEAILSFLAFATVAAITPGPSNVMITATGVAVGLARGIPCVIGAALGMASLIFIASLGLSTVVTALPWSLTAIRLGGSLLLLWMAWRIATAAPSAAGADGRAVGFGMAALFQLANPKGWIVAAGAAATYLAPSPNPQTLQALLLAALFFVAAAPSGFAWLALGSALGRITQDARAGRAVNIAMGVLLAASVLMLL